MAAYTDPLAWLVSQGVNSSAGDGKNFNEQWLNAFKGLQGQQLINVDGSLWSNAPRASTTGDNGPTIEQQIAAERQVAALNAAGLRGGSNSLAQDPTATGRVTLGGQDFNLGWNGNGWTLTQIGDNGVAGRKLQIALDANGNVKNVDLAYSPGWDRTGTLMLGSVLGAAAGGVAAGAYGAGSGAAGGTAAGAAGGTAAAGGGTTAAIGGAAGSGIAAGAGSAGGAAAGTTAAGAAAGTTAGVGGLGAGAAASLGSQLAGSGGSAAASGATAATQASWLQTLQQYGGNVADAYKAFDTMTGGRAASILGGLIGGGLGALSSEDQTMTSTQTTRPNDPTAINQAISNYGAIAGGSQDYQAAVNPYANAENPYLAAAIDAANADTVRNYNFLAPAQYSQGSSFGNSGLGFLEVNDRANVLSQLANTSATMRNQGYQQAATLADAYAQRTDAANQFNTQARLNANQGLIGGGQALGQTQTSSTTAPGNIWASTLGGAILGSQFGNSSLWGGGNTSRTSN